MYENMRLEEIPYGYKMSQLRNYLLRRSYYIEGLDDDLIDNEMGWEIDKIDNVLELMKRGKI